MLHRLRYLACLTHLSFFIALDVTPEFSDFLGSVHHFIYELSDPCTDGWVVYLSPVRDKRLQACLVEHFSRIEMKIQAETIRLSDRS